MLMDLMMPRLATLEEVQAVLELEKRYEWVPSDIIPDVDIMILIPTQVLIYKKGEHFFSARLGEEFSNDLEEIQQWLAKHG